MMQGYTGARAYVGVDCGLSGAIAVISETGDILRCEKMPTIKDGTKRKIDLETLDSILSYPMPSAAGFRFIYTIEDPGGHAPSASGLRSMTYSFAVTEAFIFKLGLRYQTIQSQKWQKEFWSRPSGKRTVKFDTKGAALAAVKKLWPRATLTFGRALKPHDGLVDALLIAEYGRRKF